MLANFTIRIGTVVEESPGHVRKEDVAVVPFKAVVHPRFVMTFHSFMLAAFVFLRAHLPWSLERFHHAVDPLPVSCLDWLESVDTLTVNLTVGYVDVQCLYSMSR